MSLINLIMKLLLHFSRLETQEYESLKADSEAWWMNIRTPKELTEEGWNDWKEAEKISKDENLAKFKYYCNHWVARLGFAIGYIVLFREITKFMNPQVEQEEKSIH